MRIAVCDDEKEALANISSLLNEYKLFKNMDLAVTAFQSAAELVCQIQGKARFDVIILDIIMPALNGIHAAKEIRELDKNVKIVFLTSTPDFAVDSYSVGAYFYALKPIAKEKLFPLLDNALLDIDRQDKECLIVRSKSGITRVPLNSLIYCEIIDKTVLYSLSNGDTLSSPGSMTVLESALLKYPKFIKPHRSFVVNMDFIKALANGDILLENGVKIPVPRGKFNELKQAYLEYSFNPSAGNGHD